MHSSVLWPLTSFPEHPTGPNRDWKRAKVPGRAPPLGQPGKWAPEHGHHPAAPAWGWDAALTPTHRVVVQTNTHHIIQCFIIFLLQHRLYYVRFIKYYFITVILLFYYCYKDHTHTHTLCCCWPDPVMTSISVFLHYLSLFRKKLSPYKSVWWSLAFGLPLCMMLLLSVSLLDVSVCVPAGWCVGRFPLSGATSSIGT